MVSEGGAIPAMLQPAPTDPPVEPETVDAQTKRHAQAAPTLDADWRAGRKLAEARRQLGLSIEEVAERIRVRREFLEALEDMNVKSLPGKAYALAFLRSYARELGIDDDAIVDQFQDECALGPETLVKHARAPLSRPQRERPWLAAAALVVLAAGFVGWQALGRQEQQRVETVAPAAPAAPGSVEPVSPGDHRVVEIRAVADAWLEARGPDGTVFLSSTLRQGDVYRPDPSPGWTLHARDGGAFEVYVNGVSAGPLGAAGMPVLGRSLDEIQPTAQAGLASPPG